MWFTLAIIGYFLLAVVFILDKYILTKSVTKPIVYTFYSTIFMFGALVVWPFGVALLEGSDWFLAIGSGIAFGFGLWAMFVAVKNSEASHVNPFIGAVVTVATYILSTQFLGEELDALQTVGVIILGLATLLLSRETTEKGSGWQRGYLFAVLSGIFFGVSHVASKYIYEIYPFITGFVWTRASTGLVGLFLLPFPEVWRLLFKRPSQATAKRPSQATVKKIGHKTFSLVVSDKIIGIMAVVLIQYAIAKGSVTVVNALSGAQYAFLFIIIIALTKLRPQIFREYFTKREVAMQILAIALLAVGLWFVL